MSYVNQVNSPYKVLRKDRSQHALSAVPLAGDGTTAKPARAQVVNEVHKGARGRESVLRAWYGREVEVLNGEQNAEEMLQQSQEELRHLSTQLLTIQENERQRIAADLHDGIGQSLSLVKLTMESVMLQLKAGEYPEAETSMQQAIHKIRETMTELHRTTMDLRPSMLDDLGIIPTLSWFFREFEIAWRGRRVEKDICVAESEVPAPLKATIFRILQEAMCNIVKHADADWIRVRLKNANGILLLLIEDNGHGFDLECVSASRGSDRGFGLMTMRERARSSGGSFELKSIIDHGTRITIAWRLDGTSEHFSV